MARSRRRFGLGIVLALATLLLVGRLVAGWYVEYQWYEALDAGAIYRAAVGNLVALRGVAFLVAGILLFLNLWAVRYSIATIILPRRVGNLEIGEELPGRTLGIVVLLVSVVLAGVLALSLNDWTSVELIRGGEPFRESDPFFQMDLAFWVYWLPLEEQAHAWMAVVLLVVTVLTMLLYALTPSLRWAEGRLQVSHHVRRHLLLLCALFLLLLAWSYRLDAFALLLDGEGAGRAFQSLDHRVGIPGRLVLAMASVVCAMLVAWAGWVGQLRLVLAATATLALLALGTRQLLPPLAARLGSADPEQRERPYRAMHAAFSRRAFDVDRLVVAEPPARSLPANDAPAVAVWDAEAIRRAAGARQGAATPAGSLGWTLVAGQPVAVVAQPPAGPEPGTRWSLQLRAAASTGAEGQLPEVEISRVARDLPPVLVGDGVIDAALVIDSAGGIAAPALDGRVARLLHAWGLQNPRLLGDDTDPFTRVVRVRDVRDRVGRLFPFFLPGNRVAPIVQGDSLWWVLHLYSASSHYPLSEPIVLPDGDVTYFRHAAIGLVNAHTGRVVAIRGADPDPIARSWMRRFPALFVEPDEVNRDLVKQLPPPADGVLVQARVYARHGRRGDLAPPSHLARATGADSGFAFPGLSPFVEDGHLAVAFPVLDATESLRAVVTGTGGGAPSTRVVPTDPTPWRDLIDRMARSLDSAAARTPRGAPAPMHGPVRAFVWHGRPAFVQALYDWPAGQPPALRWVALGAGDSVRVGRSLASALGLPEAAPVGEPLTAEAFRQRVAALYRSMSEALDRRELGAFAEAWEELGRLLREGGRVP